MDIYPLVDTLDLPEQKIKTTTFKCINLLRVL